MSSEGRAKPSPTDARCRGAPAFAPASRCSKACRSAQEFVDCGQSSSSPQQLGISWAVADPAARGDDLAVNSHDAGYRLLDLCGGQVTQRVACGSVGEV